MKAKRFFESPLYSNSRFKGVMILMLLFTLVLAACQSATLEPTLSPIAVEPTATAKKAYNPAVSVSDQEIAGGMVKIAEAVSDGPGWMVIHAQAEGKPGPILGYTALEAGENAGVLVEIDPDQATETLYAMLHTDAGELGTFEFPDGPDGPVLVDEKVVTPAFTVKKAMVESTGDELVLSLSSNDELGSFLVGPDEMTLYLFTNDEDGITNCYGKCAENWPPLMLEDGQSLVAGEGVFGNLGTAERTDGGTMVTYNGMPLYYWIKDGAPGDTTGHGVGGVWAVVSPETRPYLMDPAASQVSYEVGEVFLNENRFNAAVGVTSGIEGKVYIDPINPLASLVSPIKVDISQFTSDSQRRDNKIREDFLESAAFPIATFIPTQIKVLPETYNEGDQLALQITGDLMVKEVTQPVTFEATVVGQDSQLSGEATTTILMSDFGVGPISILGILETEDEVKLTINFVARP